MSNVIFMRARQLLVALPMCLLLTSVSGATLYTVPGSYDTIQDAVNAANASGDRIEVSSVMSQEVVQVVDKDIEIVAVASPIVVGSFSWTNPSGASVPGGGLVDGFHVTGDVTALNVTTSFVARDLNVEGEIEVNSVIAYGTALLEVTGCRTQHGILLRGSHDKTGGPTEISDCEVYGASAGIVLIGYQPAISNCEVTGSGNIVCDGEDFGSVVGCIVQDGSIEIIAFNFDADAINNVVTGGNIAVTSPQSSAAIGNVVRGGGISGISDDFEARENSCFDGVFGIDGVKGFVDIHDNLVVRCGRGIYGGDRSTIRSNTVVDCANEGIRAWDASDVVEQNIVVGCGTGIRLIDPQGAGCNDVWNNAQNWLGAPDQEGINGNISLDPLFCDPIGKDYSLASASSCLPGNHPDGVDCGTIGAFGEGCAGPVPVVDASWGAVKSLFRK